MSHDNVVSRALEREFLEERERRIGTEERRCSKVGDGRLRSGEEERCPDNFAVWAFAVPF